MSCIIRYNTAVIVGDVQLGTCSTIMVDTYGMTAILASVCVDSHRD